MCIYGVNAFVFPFVDMCNVCIVDECMCVRQRMELSFDNLDVRDIIAFFFFFFNTDVCVVVAAQRSRRCWSRLIESAQLCVSVLTCVLWWLMHRDPGGVRAV